MINFDELPVEILVNVFDVGDFDALVLSQLRSVCSIFKDAVEIFVRHHFSKKFKGLVTVYDVKVNEVVNVEILDGKGLFHFIINSCDFYLNHNAAEAIEKFWLHYKETDKIIPKNHSSLCECQFYYRGSEKQASKKMSMFVCMHMNFAIVHKWRKKPDNIQYIKSIDMLSILKINFDERFKDPQFNETLSKLKSFFQNEMKRN